MRGKIHSRFLFLSLFVFLPNNVGAANQPVYSADTEDKIFELNQELMNIEVTTASRRPQKLTEVPAAVFVITQEDIRRSGATSIPEALRMAPGIQVARIGTDKWSISVRGFNGRFANKLQVLMDDLLLSIIQVAK